jgi:hypothetical protein
MNGGSEQHQCLHRFGYYVISLCYVRWSSLGVYLDDSVIGSTTGKDKEVWRRDLFPLFFVVYSTTLSVSQTL